MRRSVMSTRRKNKATDGSELMRLEAKLEKFRAKLSKKRAKAERMKKRLNKIKAKAEEMESENVRMFDENKLAIEENIDIKLSVDVMKSPKSSLLRMFLEWSFFTSFRLRAYYVRQNGYYQARINELDGWSIIEV